MRIFIATTNRCGAEARQRESSGSGLIDSGRSAKPGRPLQGEDT